jgi:hypothetical protein
MLNKAKTHIQNIAPGPPMERAVATPAIFPMPTVLARAVDVAWNGVILPLAFVFVPAKMVPKVFVKMRLIFRIWKPFDLIVKKTAITAIKTRVHGPQRMLSIPAATSKILSNMPKVP